MDKYKRIAQIFISILFTAAIFFAALKGYETLEVFFGILLILVLIG